MGEPLWPSFEQSFTGDPIVVGTPYHDTQTAVVLVMLMLFSLLQLTIRRTHLTNLYTILSLKRGDSLNLREHGFDLPLRIFYLFQTFTLLSICLEPQTHTVWGVPLQPSDYWMRVLMLMGILMLGFSIIYLAYCWVGYVFLDPEGRNLWNVNQIVLLTLFGLSLYIPTFLLILVPGSDYWILPVVLALYAIFRLSVVTCSLRLFTKLFNRSLHLFLYLCGCEIGPVIFVANGILQTA